MSSAESRISLREITRDNIYEVLRLRVTDDQRVFVADNAVSLAETWVEPSFRPLAIYAGEELVGFTMYGLEEATGRWWIIRLMIVPEHQGRGYGRAAMNVLTQVMMEREAASEVVTSCDPANVVARHLYSSLGFHETGEIDDGEVVMVRTLAPREGW
jgi:diamine N-acetyltransferase